MTARFHRAFLSACLLASAALFFSCHRAGPDGAIVIAIEAFPSAMDPRMGTDLASDRLFALLHRGLFKVNGCLEPEPDLAECCEQVSPLEYVIRLKKGLKFSDGKPLSSADAVFTISSIIADGSRSPKKGELGLIRSVEAVDGESLRIRLDSPSAPILTLLNFGILPEDTPFAGETSPPGLGPFRVASMNRGRDIFLEENPYSVPGPETEAITLKVIEDPVLRALEMKRGSVDIVVNDLPPDSVYEFERSGFTVKRFPGTNYSYIGINCRKKHLDDPNVRKAISMAINRKAILKNIMRGYGREATGMLSPENWAYFPAVNPPYDPSGAEAILETAGIKRNSEGVRMKLSYKTSLNKISRFAAEAMAEDLREVGILLEIQSLEWGSFYSDVKKGNFDLFSLNWIGIKDPDAYRLRFESSATPPFGFNRGWYSNPALDALLRTGAEETDREKRKEIYSKVQSIVSEDVPYINLWWPDIVAVSNERIEPFAIAPDGDFSFAAGLRIKGHS